MRDSWNLAHLLSLIVFVQMSLTGEAEAALCCFYDDSLHCACIALALVRSLPRRHINTSVHVASVARVRDDPSSPGRRPQLAGGHWDGKEKRYRTAMTLLNVLMGMRTKRHGGSVSFSFSDSSASCPLQLLRDLTNMGWMQMVRKCDQIWSKCSSEKEGESGLIHTLVGLDVVDVRTTSKLHSEERSVNKPPPR